MPMPPYPSTWPRGPARGPARAARRLLRRSVAAGRPRGDHPRPFRPCPGRPRHGARHARDPRHHAGPPRRWGRPRPRRPLAYDETRRSSARSRSALLPAGHVLGSAQVIMDIAGTRVIVSGDYKRRPDPTCARLRACRLRPVHHRGDLRPAGVPPSADRRGDRQAAALGGAVPGALPRDRRLCAGQGAAADRAAARGRLGAADLPARRPAGLVRPLRPARRRAGPAAPGHRRREGRRARS